MGQFLRAVPQQIKTVEIEGSATAKQLDDISGQMAMLQGVSDNAGNVYYGGAAVTIPDGTADTTSGLQLTAGSLSPWIPIENLNQLYIICDNAGDDVVALVVR